MEYVFGGIMTLMVAILSCVIQELLKETRTLSQEKKNDELKREEGILVGLVCLLRIQLIEYHDKYMNIGSVPIYVYESFNCMYDAYHALGGNGMMTHIKEDMDKLEIANKKEENHD